MLLFWLCCYDSINNWSQVYFATVEKCICFEASFSTAKSFKHFIFRLGIAIESIAIKIILFSEYIFKYWSSKCSYIQAYKQIGFNGTRNRNINPMGEIQKRKLLPSYNDYFHALNAFGIVKI